MPSTHTRMNALFLAYAACTTPWPVSARPVITEFSSCTKPPPLRRTKVVEGSRDTSISVWSLRVAHRGMQARSNERPTCHMIGHGVGCGQGLVHSGYYSQYPTGCKDCCRRRVLAAAAEACGASCIECIERLCPGAASESGIAVS